MPGSRRQKELGDGEEGDTIGPLWVDGRVGLDLEKGEDGSTTTLVIDFADGLRACCCVFVLNVFAKARILYWHI